MKRYLVVDDELIERNGMRSLLLKKDASSQVLCATDGENALEIIQNGYVPDVVITDIRMPFMDGLELAKFLHRHHPEVKLIICSAYDEFEYARSAIRSGVKEFVLKPIAQTEFFQALNHISVVRGEIEKETVKNDEEASRNQLLVRQTKRIIHSQYSEDIGLEFIAKQLQRTPGYVAHVFQQETGQSPTKYLTQYRMEKAAKLLTTTNMRVADIAYAVGYLNTSYFGTVFRSFYDMTPLRYREKYAS